jgi:mono/diheme cytochrome c family protein
MKSIPIFRYPFIAVIIAGLLLSACDDMSNQPRYEPLEESAFFTDHRSARPLLDGTVPRQVNLEEESALSARTAGGELVAEIPITITLELLEEGREQYNIFCSPCHGLDGYGQGMIVQRGFPPPPSLHEDRLLQAPAGHFNEVIANGFGVMYPYRDRVDGTGRWAIVAYIRALQLSQNATLEDVPAEERPTLEEGQP